MMETFTLLHQIVSRYQQLDQLSMELAQAAVQNEEERIAELHGQMEQLQEKTRTDDALLMEQLAGQPLLLDHPATRAWLQLMQGIHTRNQQLLPQVQTRLAHHRSELHTLHKGASSLQGYRSGARPVGSLLSSAG